jgi:ABC-2 type transport system permease protein
MVVYLQVGRTGYLRNVAYKWSHMINNLASALFGFMYIGLWQTVAPVTSSTDPYTKGTMTSIVVLGQVIAWVTIFLPAGLGIQASVRTGAIALEMARPVPFMPTVLARESGNVAYQFIYRAVPLALLFAVTVGFPMPASLPSLLLAIPSLMLGIAAGLLLVYTVGMTALWTTEIRWAHWTYFSLTNLLSGVWIPANLLPGWLGRVAPYSPLTAQAYYPIRIYLGLSGPEGLAVQAIWVVLLAAWCWYLTGLGMRRVVIQGG